MCCGFLTYYKITPGRTRLELNWIVANTTLYTKYLVSSYLSQSPQYVSLFGHIIREQMFNNNECQLKERETVETKFYFCVTHHVFSLFLTSTF